MIKNINILIFFIFSVTSSAQVDDIQKEARNLFSSSDSNIKSLNLTGFKDGGIEIRLYLANKGDEWKGICYYPSSQEKIRMEGGVVEGNLLLDEFDRDDNVFGMWLIDFKNPGYNAKWRNIAGSRTFDIKFYELNYLPENNYAVAKMYSGHLLNDDFEIILMDYHKNKLKGNFINIRQKEYLKNNIECNDQACDSFTVNVKNNKIKKLICNRKENDIISITVFNNTGTQFKSEIAEVNKLKFANRSYINKKYSLNINYPVFDNKKLNNYLDKELDLLIDSLQEEMEKIFFENYDFNDRLKLEANGWFDIDYFSNNVFSARFIIQKSYSQQTKCFPVNLSIKTGKKIKTQNQFSSDFNFKFYSEQFLRENIKKLPGYRSTMVRNYLKPENFKYITINRAGIVLSTEFNSIFGTYKMIIPYSDIKNKIKRRSILQKIIKL